MYLRQNAITSFRSKSYFIDFSLISQRGSANNFTLCIRHYFLSVISTTYRSVANPSITGAIRNRLWNTRNTCGIFIREYRFAARMSVQRSPVIALVCFPKRHRRLNVANTGKPSRRTYRSLYDIHQPL